MTEHRLSAPDGRRTPVKRNVFEMAQISNSQLCPIFPYLGEGAVVPAVVVFKAGYRGGPDSPLGGFQHLNSVDEVMISFSGFPGFSSVTGRLHPVFDPIMATGGDNPDASMVATVTQRQLTGATQHEAIILRCEKCNHLLLKHEFDVVPADADTGLGPARFATIVGSAEAVHRYNADESLRTCKKCEFVNEPFPVERWGWGAYAAQAEAAHLGKSGLHELLNEA
ncbi:hypothetical protein OQ968_02085 [Mycobacterium sp. 663a-19]|uniref:hypothetical protein n=1 Tax=Mycobacterium sp. 663a-19 TaxID=2986148 RepID=UPI002D1EF9F4|nr:hypothetical protein [Mycobacterium sp. 663a-19]MEB3980050.1 hypothetical protein [Mycobacterium sp. 663a-19]